MPIRLHNTLTHRVEVFEPIDPPRVSMYNCGPTVYDFVHIGNFKTFLFADVLRRFLELCGYEVLQVMNLTDVGHMTEDQLADGAGEDKMQLAARRLREAKKAGQSHAAHVADPDDPYQIAQFYVDAFLDDARRLRMKIVDEYPQRMPRATEHIQAMQRMIQSLIDRGHAYVTDNGTVYFSVESFPDYGRLSGNTLDQLRGGAGGRVLDEHQQGKRHPADFLLWKPDPAHLMKWDSPWGPGYPGWHIECSAMATAVLGRDVIDIHTGGEDNIFPHHECEIAQTRGATGQPHFARFWLHSRHLMVEGQKMSKSKGNFYTLRDVLEGRVTGHPVDPAVLRLELIKGHYRSNLNFSRKGLEDSASAVRRLRDVAADLARRADGQTRPPDPDHPALVAFREALADDLNTAGALAATFEFLRDKHGDPAQSLSVLQEMDRVLGLLPTEADEAEPAAADNGLSDAEAQRLCRQIDQARADKDFANADALRQRLIDANFEVRTGPRGTTASRKLA